MQTRDRVNISFVDLKIKLRRSDENKVATPQSRFEDRAAWKGCLLARCVNTSGRLVSGLPLSAEGFSMCVFVPEIYDDELFYSFLARLINYNGWSSSDAVLQLHGQAHNKNGRRIADLPANMVYTCSAIFGRTEAETNWIVDEHTLFPYYASFISKNARDRLRHKLLYPHSVAGRCFPAGARKPISRVKINLKFCEKCNQESMERLGEYYWRRSHQLPLVDVCPKHSAILKESDVKVIAPHGYYVAASRSVCHPQSRKCLDVDEDADLDQIFRLSEQSIALLARPRFDPDLDALREERISRLAMLGVVNHGRQIDYFMLSEFAKSHIGTIIELYPRLSLTRSQRSWPVELLRARKKVNPPIYHLLMEMLLMGMEAAQSPEWQENMPPEHAFGKGPWSCRNRITCNSCIERVEMTSFSRRCNGIRAEFTCRCGFSYIGSRRTGSRIPKFEYKDAGDGLRAYFRNNLEIQYNSIAGKLLIGEAAFDRLKSKLASVSMNKSGRRDPSRRIGFKGS